MKMIFRPYANLSQPAGLVMTKSLNGIMMLNRNNVLPSLMVDAKEMQIDSFLLNIVKEIVENSEIEVAFTNEYFLIKR